MKKSTKIWLGVATIWPVLYIFLFFAAIVAMMIFASDGGASDPGRSGSMVLPLGFLVLMGVHMITILGSLALTAFYIVRVFKTEQLDQNLKIMWTLLMFFTGMLAQPVFWYLYIWRAAPVLASQKPALLNRGIESLRNHKVKPEPAYVPPSQPPDWR
jgi:hypothetical protein